mgnify:CR=1 FL=1
MATTFTAVKDQIVDGKQLYKITRSNGGHVDNIELITLDALNAQKLTTQAKIDAVKLVQDA